MIARYLITLLCMLTGLSACGSSSPCLPPALLYLRVIDGSSAQKLSSATVKVNGLPIQDIGGDVCARVAPSIPDCTHGIQYSWPTGFDWRNLTIEVANPGYLNFGTTIVPEVEDDQVRRTEYREIRLFKSGSGTPDISSNNSNATRCD